MKALTYLLQSLIFFGALILVWKWWGFEYMVAIGFTDIAIMMRKIPRLPLTITAKEVYK